MLQFGVGVLLARLLSPNDFGVVALGYVVLPAGADLSQPIDVYWNDRRITAIFAPAS